MSPDLHESGLKSRFGRGAHISAPGSTRELKLGTDVPLLNVALHVKFHAPAALTSRVIEDLL